MEKTALVLSIGVVNPDNGKTHFDWTIYDSWNNKGYAHLCGGFLIFSANENDFEIGDDLILRDNDSARLIKKSRIVDKSLVNRDDLLQMLLRNRFDCYPVRPFKKKRFPNKLSTSYSVKGII